MSYNPMRLDGRRIMVTGASSGLGRACAQVISKLGGQVVLVARNRDRLQETLASLEGADHQLEVFDLNEVEQIPSWMKSLTSAGRMLSGLVHCAGIEITLPVKTMRLSDYERVMVINTTAAFALAKGFRQRGVCAAPASIIFISSAAAKKLKSGMSAYAASKAALHGLTRGLAAEFAREDIRVNVLTVGLVQTEMVMQMNANMTDAQVAKIVNDHLLGLGQPDDVANLVTYLLSPAARWITGSSIVIDGGYSIH